MLHNLHDNFGNSLGRNETGSHYIQVKDMMMMISIGDLVKPLTLDVVVSADHTAYYL